jgi:hypothetical protein
MWMVKAVELEDRTSFDSIGAGLDLPNTRYFPRPRHHVLPSSVWNLGVILVEMTSFLLLL